MANNNNQFSTNPPSTSGLGGSTGTPGTPRLVDPRNSIENNGPDIWTSVENAANELAKRKWAEMMRQQNVPAGGRSFTIFNPSTDIVDNKIENVTTGLWTNNVGTLTTFFTSSAFTANQKKYYYDVYQSMSSGETAEQQFSIAYGNIKGSGSVLTNSDYPTQAIYSQYRTLLSTDGLSNLTVNGVTSNDIYVINVYRARMRNKLDPGNFELNLAELSGAGVINMNYTGSAVGVKAGASVISLIDDSGDTSQDVVSTQAAGRIYNVVSGTIAGGIYNSSAPEYYGKVYPDLGIIFLSAEKMNLSCSFNTVTGSDIAGDNCNKLFVAISGAAVLNSDYGFSARSIERVTSTYYFVRVKNAEYNFSNNPTFVTESTADGYGRLRFNSMINDPKVYVTTIGLYNDTNELLAVAKVSQPLIKSFSDELSIKIKLDF